MTCSALALFASARQWVHVTYQEAGLPTINLDLSGRDLDPLSAGLATLVLTAVLALWIARGVAHRALALVLLLAGVLLAVASWRCGPHVALLSSLNEHLELALGRSATGYLSTTSSIWWLISFNCGLLIAIGGAALVVVGHDRPRSRSDYERTSTDTHHMSPWQALDQGVDPTESGDH